MMNFYKNLCGRKGFTLIELVAVTVMLGVLAGMLLPSILRMASLPIRIQYLAERIINLLHYCLDLWAGSAILVSCTVRFIEQNHH